MLQHSTQVELCCNCHGLISITDSSAGAVTRNFRFWCLGSFEMWRLLAPAPKEIWCPGMVGRIFGPNLFLDFLHFLFLLYSVYSQFPGLSSIPCLSCLLGFFPSCHVCTLFVSSLCNASSTMHAGIYLSCFCLTWPDPLLDSELVVTCSVVSICSPVCR